MNRRILGGLAAAAMLAGGLAITSGAASATSEQPPPDSGDVCYETQTYQEFKYKRVVTTPAVDEVSHTEYLYEKEVRTETFKTQYEIDKYVRDRTREVTYSASIWQNFSPNDKQGTFEGPPSWPTDPDGTWQHENKPIPPGQAGPDGVYQNGNGNGSWFYRQASVANGYTDWTAWSAPYRWEPIGSHLAWVDVVPAPNWKAHGTQTDTYQRQWSEYPTGAEKQVSTGFTTETVSSGWSKVALGAPWKLVDTRKVIDVEAVPGSTETFYWDGTDEGTTKKGKAVWTEETSIEGWTQFKERDQERQVEVPCPTPESFVRVTSICLGPGIDPGIPGSGEAAAGEYIIRVRHESGVAPVDFNLQIAGNVLIADQTIGEGESLYFNLPAGSNGVKAVPTSDAWVNTYGGTASTPTKECTPVPTTTTPPPETTVPETTVPETTVPETTVPETTVPETTVPETTVPETTVPVTTAPSSTVAPTVPTTADQGGPLPPAQAPTTSAPAASPATPAAGLPATGSSGAGVTALIALLVTSLGGAALLAARRRNVMG